MQTGTVKFYDKKRGFGFIMPDNGGENIFVHATGIPGNRIEVPIFLNAMDRVEFDVVNSKKDQGKLRAVKVRVIFQESA